MRKFIVLSVAAAAMAVPSAALANAAPANQTPLSGFGGGIAETGWIGTSQGNTHMTTTQYKASYTDGLEGPVTCSGVNQRGTNVDSTKTINGVSAGRDSFTCTSTIGNLTTLGWTPHVGSTTYWASDFWGLQNHTVTAWMTVIATDGLTYYTAVATY